MLKQLELVGFKSFAERTVFSFGGGITGIVGPNGSGKSNVVDAVRWIMGEQSAKSLRGGGMTDVIFNGSATRKSLGLAEVSLTMDNSRRFLSLDADEVQITRRVYRDGTGEYLINRQVARLKDIKEMFLGSGAGVDAYCIIAQGRVESLLQASSQERRFILEEAAGISRFRVKKLETLRKLEQVEQNLQRVRDIHEELSRQLQSVRLQAAKAERFREYSEQLKQLRVALALQEWHQETQQAQSATTQLTELKAVLAARSAEASEHEQQLLYSETMLVQEENAARSTEAIIAQCREKIAALEGAIHHESASMNELQIGLRQSGERQSILLEQDNRLSDAISTVEKEKSARELERTDCEIKLAETDSQFNTTVGQLASIRRQLQSGKQSLYERMQEAARAHNDLVSVRTQLDSLRAHRRRLDEKHTKAQGTIGALDLELKALEATERDAHERTSKLREQLVALRQRKEDYSAQLDSLTLSWSVHREKLSGLNSRMQVLQTLEQNREGVGAGPRKILESITQLDESFRGGVYGMLADLILVDREHAAIVDAVLGDQVQAIVVKDWETVNQVIQALGEELPGRVSFLPISTFSSSSSQAPIPGLESLARYVGATHADLGGLPGQLLGSTWLVDTLESARKWAQQFHAARLVTKTGEVLEACGLLTLGPDRQEHGFMSRKSELRELMEKTADLESLAQECDREITQLRAILAQVSAQEEHAEQAVQVLGEETAALRSRLEQQRLTGQNLAEEARLRQGELVELDQEILRLSENETRVNQRTVEAESLAQQIQSDLQTAESDQVTLESQRQKEQDLVVNAKLALAEAQQQAAGLSQRLISLQQDREEKRSEIGRLQQEQAELQNKLIACQVAWETAGTSLSQIRMERASAESRLAECVNNIAQWRQQTSHLREKNNLIRQEWQQLVDQVHVRELQANELRLRLDTLAQRLLEEHEVVLSEAYSEYQLPEQPLDSTLTNQQIQDLRRKIARLGNVSLDSLQELASLETRAQDLQHQENDLRQAKSSLDEIIERINNDSKKLFQDTYDAVRAHFQELFRKLFGGGMADIVLENPEDLLETGVDILARPPGKEMRNMSLLSGGEKTMTAVALLLAIFKNKPSPFCILDEVDAALDEANVGRFAGVLREFLHLSQFILVTHSKKTMAAADVLYGVTMQEAGVSKRVAVRLEDYEEPAHQLAA